MTFNWDDFEKTNNRLDLLWKLKELRPDFKATVFAIPANSDFDFWESVPDWLELAVHGWQHLTSTEAHDWKYDKMNKILPSLHPRFVHGFKAPGWQISDETFRWLKDHSWWVADQPYNRSRRPKGIRYYEIGEGNWHGHIQDVCGNGLEETWSQVVEKVRNADEFKFVSEVVQRWKG